MNRSLDYAARAMGWLVMAIVGTIWRAVFWVLDGIVGLFRR